MGSAGSLAVEVEALVREAAWRAAKLCELTSREPAHAMAWEEGPPLASARETARLMLYRRRLRDQMLPGLVFSDPGWDILLNLFVAREEGRPMDLADIRVASGLAEDAVAPALRALEAAGYVDGPLGAAGGPALSSAAAVAIRTVLEASLLP